MMATATAFKKSHTTTKSMFTKAKNNLLRIIENGSDIEIVENS